MPQGLDGAARAAVGAFREATAAGAPRGGLLDSARAAAPRR